MQRQPVLLERPSSDGEGSRDAPKYGQVQDLLIGNPLGVLSLFFWFFCLNISVGLTDGLFIRQAGCSGGGGREWKSVFSSFGKP